MQRHAERFLVVGNDVARLGPARRLLGLLHATLGDPATADDELALAATASAAAGSALHTGWCNLHRAQVAREPAGPQVAAAHLADVAAITAKHDLPALRRRARELSSGT